MGLRLFGRSFSRNEGYTPQLPAEPRADFFIIKEIIEVNGNAVCVVKYPNCTNFEGKKILVFKGKTAAEIRNVKLLDPHFSNKGLSPFARFIPSSEGMEAAILLCGII